MRYFLVFILLFVAASAEALESRRIESPLRALDFNSMNSTYMERPTWVSVMRLSPGEDAIDIEFDPYHHDPKRIARYSITLAKSHIDEYLSLIEKYKAWSEQASQAGDMFTKDIGKAKSSSGVKAHFRFHSASKDNHLLYIEMCALFMCTEDGAHFDAKGVIEIEGLLARLKSGELTAEDVSKKYN